MEIFCHPAFLEASLVEGDQAIDQVTELNRRKRKLLLYASKPAKRKDMLDKGLGISNHTKNARRYVDPLLEIDLLERTIKGSPNSPL